jgi:sucrose-6-phosphate hydrolase SacC (GH32 family)
MAQDAQPEDQVEIGDKTLVAWVSPANLTQRGGSVLTIEKSRGVFDAIVLGEIAPAKWMAGSNAFRRTEQDQSDWPSESVTNETFVQIALVYQGTQVKIYRNAALQAQYDAGSLEQFGEDSIVILGLRHLDAGSENRFFTGRIDDARIYDVALTADQLSQLKPNQPSRPEPIAWWDFEAGRTTDRMNLFPATILQGNARIEEGDLNLAEEGAHLIAMSEAPDTGLASGNYSQADRASREVRERLLSDPHRPGYHFVIPEGRAMPFDPNGAIFWKGRYHLFYIFQDQRGHNWGHVSSRDMVHWRHHRTGLVSGMFSGNCFVNKEGQPTMCYHQVGEGNAMAVALDDELNQWKKLPSNPITPKTSPGGPHHGKYRSWDPYGWLEGDTYYAIFGGQRPGIAKSQDLKGPWQYVGDLLANTVAGVSIDEDVSCADFFKLGDRHMLLCISHRLGCRYYLGDWRNEQFHPTFHAQMSWVDNSFFAPESLLDDRGRRIMWAWIFDGPAFGTRTDFGWSGTMSLPRVLRLASDGTLRMSPPEELAVLRYDQKHLDNFDIAADAESILEGVQGNSIELDLEIVTGTARQYGVKVCCSPDGAEQTRIYYDVDQQQLMVDTRQSSQGESPRTVEAGPLVLRPGEPLKLRVFVDRSVVEVFANERQAVMRRIYPSRKDSVAVRAFALGGPMTIVRADTWQMDSSNAH